MNVNVNLTLKIPYDGLLEILYNQKTIADKWAHEKGYDGLILKPTFTIKDKEKRIGEFRVEVF